MLKQLSRLGLGASALAIVAAATMLGSTGASAGPIPSCNGFNVSTAAGSNECTVDGVNFTFTNLTFAPSAAGDSLTISGTSDVGNDVTLQFQITGLPPVDILLGYTASSAAGINGIDASYGNGNSNGTITETACSVAIGLTGCAKANILASLEDPTGNGGTVVSDTFTGSVGTAFISKDIEDPTPGSFSEFTDSVLITPEPITISLFGVGLAGIGFGAARRRKAPKA